MSMAQRYADYLEREAHHAATPVRAEAIRQVANKLRELERENAALAAERDSALERLTCWLIEMPATSEWPAIWLAITTDGRRWSSDGGTLYATGGNWYFTTAAIEALKFADEESANAYVSHNKIKDVVVTEHIFDNSSILNARPVPAAPAIPPDMILMPREPDETLVAGFVGCETRDEAKLGWAVAVRMQDVRTGTAALAAPAPVTDCGDTIPNTPAAECEKYRSALAYLVDEVRSSGGLCPASACGYGINEVSCCRKDLKDALKAADELLSTPASAGKGE